MLLPLNERGVELTNFVMSVLQNLPSIPYMMAAEELQLLAESWSEETEAETSQRPEQDRPGADPDHPSFLKVVQPGSIGGVSVTS